MGDIEQELKAYVSRRAGGRSALAARRVRQAAQCYHLAIEALRRHGNSSQQFWVAVNMLEPAITALMCEFDGPPDYYFGRRQYEELLFPAMQGVGRGFAHGVMAGHQACVIDDWILHTHCEELSIEQQLAGVRELCRHLGLMPAVNRAQPGLGQGIAFTILNGIAKLAFLGTRRGRPPLPAGDFERPVDEGVAAEAARLGGLKAALQLMVDQPELDGPWEIGGEAEMGILYMAQRMAGALLSQGHAAAASKVAKWAADQPSIMSMLMERLEVPAVQNPHCTVQTGKLAVHMAWSDTAMLGVLRYTGLLDTIAKRQAELAASADLAGLAADLGDMLQQLQAASAKEARPQGQQQCPESQQGQQQAPHAQQAQQPAAIREQLQALPVRELKARLAAAGIDSSGCAEKGELIDLLLRSSVAAPQEGAVSAEAQQNGGGSSGSGANGGEPAHAEQGPAAAAAEAAAGAAAEQQPARRCVGCGATSGPAGCKLRRCSGCRAVYFCTEQCQRSAWPEHRAACRAAQQQRA